MLETEPPTYICGVQGASRDIYNLHSSILKEIHIPKMVIPTGLTEDGANDDSIVQNCCDLNPIDILICQDRLKTGAKEHRGDVLLNGCNRASGVGASLGQGG
jgi:hypothetical protein